MRLGIDLIDGVVSLFAPHICYVCGDEGSALCTGCRDHLERQPSICAICGNLANDYQTCLSCKRHQQCEVIYVRTPLTKLSRRIITHAKYERGLGLHAVIAQEISDALPGYMPDFTVTFVPTSAKHIRQRGFDHTHRIARNVANLHQLPYQMLLERIGSTSQVGRNREQRIHQLTGAFRYVGTSKPPRNVLLIDDVMTTGATLSECARTLKHAGVKHVYAAVFARTAK